MGIKRSDLEETAKSLQAERLGGGVVPTFCSLCGPMPGCGLNCYVKDGRLIRVEGMKEAPTNKGKLCTRAFASVQWVYSPQRLRYPLKRIGEKGEGKFERITWDEALDIIASRLTELKERYGPESLAILAPARRSYSDFLQRFLTVHGSPNYCHSGLCAMQQAFGFAYTVGFPMLGMAGADYENANLIVIWGASPAYSGAPQGSLRRILNAKGRGATLMVIKPEMQPDAAKADIWVPIRPGTDGALALAMLNVIINEHLYDADFASRWCYGFDKLVPHIQRYTPEWAEPITGLSADQIREVARLYGTMKPACMVTGNAFDQTVDSNNAVRAAAILIAITGNLDRAGGNIVPVGSKMPMVKSVHLSERYTQDFVDKLVGPEIASCFQPFVEGTSSAYYRCLDSILTREPYPVRAIIAPGTQPTVITRGSKRVVEALEKLEFFVVIDVMQNSSMPWADVVIPVATMYECDHPFEVKGNWIMARNKVIEPLGDYKSDYEFWLDLGVKMGYGEDFWNGSIEKCMNYQLENFGMTMEQLRAHATGIIYEPKPMVYEKYEQIFATPSTRLSRAPYLPQGKVAIYNTTFKENGFNPLPEWVEPPESPTGTPDLLANYPLVFFDTHASDVYTQGWCRNLPYLREIQPDPWVHIHPETAKARGIANGDWVIVESPHGWIKVKALYSPGIRPDVVMGLHGWWQGCDELGLPDYPILDGGANVNIMYSTDPDKAFDPVVTAMPKQTLVEVRKAQSRGLAAKGYRLQPMKRQ
jgi:anaerobic selenocysteine-containing dehydrogenase